MKLSIEHNKALDLLFATYKYYRYCSNNDAPILSSSSNPEDIAEIIIPSKQIKNWMKSVDSEISPFLKSDLLLLYGKIPSFANFFDTYLEIIYTNNITEPEDFISFVRNMPNDELIKTVYKYSEVAVDFASDNKTIFDTISKAYSEEVANIFVQIKKYPSEYKAKVLNLFEKFYEAFVKPNEAYTSTFIEEKLQRHNNQIKADPIAFLNIIGIGDYSKAVKGSSKVKIFISYYFDHGIFYTDINRSLLIMYGFFMEERFNQQLMQDKYKNLFKALSDAKRLEIVRLTSKRPWYNKELADYFDLTSATLSYHINLLLDLGILNFEPSDYNRYYYTTNKETLKAFFEYALEDLTSSSEDGSNF
ncbi:MAG TPA: winged helix-turn-helix domain-containing protein [Selenomonadales bacterium]|nr:winged helix-turn-helix domain-containing protein [Selenomonadales bacterium]